MKKPLAAMLFFLFFFTGAVYSQTKHQVSDKAQEKKMKKMEKRIKKQQDAFYKRQHKSEIRKGKHRSGKGNNYENIKTKPK